MTTLPNTLIMTFDPGGSLTRWSDLGRIDRETTLLRGLLESVPHIIFVSRSGARDLNIAASLQAQLGGRIDALALDQPDPELGPGREAHERVLARLGSSRSVVIQTMQLDDGGISRRLLSPLRRAGVQAALVARGGFIGSRVLATKHGPHSIDAVAAGSEEHALCKQAQLVVGVSESMIDELCWRHGVNPDRTRLIPHILDENTEPVGTADRDGHHLLTVGELAASHGVDTILHAIAAQSDPVRDRLRLTVIGDGPQRESLSNLAENLGVAATFPGRRPHAELVELMRTCAVFLHASEQRRLSKSVIEAMSHGCPVVVSDSPEFDGLVESGSTGIRVKPNPEAFAFAIANTIEDRDWRDMIGSTAARVVRTRCGFETVMKSCREVFSDALRIAPATVYPRARRAG